MYCIESVPLTGIKYVSLASVSGIASPYDQNQWIGNNEQHWPPFNLVSPSCQYLVTPTVCVHDRLVGLTLVILDIRKLHKNDFFK